MANVKRNADDVLFRVFYACSTVMNLEKPKKLCRVRLFRSRDLRSMYAPLLIPEHTNGVDLSL